MRSTNESNSESNALPASIYASWPHDPHSDFFVTFIKNSEDFGGFRRILEPPHRRFGAPFAH
jgi:hypothetical protein